MDDPMVMQTTIKPKKNNCYSLTPINDSIIKKEETKHFYFDIQILLK